ncbi:hypothetical protein [Paenibacillus glucanolyticus]|uniref:hypothetical protein n=1 Tax=Paenibacillus glucanolyticus TaxID=59843 RepID=UPI00128DF05E|nr:hypothetical protein [Paenibacillus glucanolyticus]MCA4755545.1 hypothetical protein [Mycolicibacterium fortuitum]MPY20669.1 long-chain fatty acid--CoA ligase [Paenibacillus glucanolyticus]
MRSEKELFNSFRESLTPEAQKDIDKLLFLYELFLDETDPEARETIKSELSIIEQRYNLVTDHTKKAAQ